MTISVMFVCLGNICRSPTAHGVFEQVVRDNGLQQHIRVESSGTGDWHIGESPDKRATVAAAKRGYDLQHLVAQQLMPRDFEQMDYILAMDRENLANIEAMKPTSYHGKTGLFLAYAPAAEVDEVPDPYYGGVHGFVLVLDLIAGASHGLLSQIRQECGI